MTVGRVHKTTYSVMWMPLSPNVLQPNCLCVPFITPQVGLSAASCSQVGMCNSSPHSPWMRLPILPKKWVCPSPSIPTHRPTVGCAPPHHPHKWVCPTHCLTVRCALPRHPHKWVGPTPSSPQVGVSHPTIPTSGCVSPHHQQK